MKNLIKRGQEYRTVSGAEYMIGAIEIELGEQRDVFVIVYRSDSDERSEHRLTLSDFKALFMRD